MMWKEAAVASSEVLLKNFSRGTKEYHKISIRIVCFQAEI
jgi:hypothetical protein